MASLKSAFVTVYAAHVFRYACLVVLIPFYARVLGPTEYGQVLMATALGNFVWVLQNWGFSPVGARNIAACADAQARQQEFSRQLMARLVMLPCSVCVGLLGIWWAPALRTDPALGLMAVLWGVLSGSNLGWYFQGMQHFKASVMAEVLNFGLTLVFVVALVTWQADARMALAGLLLANGVATAYAYAKAAATARLWLSPWRDAWALIRESFAMFVNTGATTVISNGGTYVLGLMSSPAQAAFYGTAERVVTTVLGLMVPAGQVLLPRFTHMIAQGNAAQAVRRQQRQAVLWATMIGAVLMLGALLLSPWVLPWVLGDQFEATIRVLQIFSPLFVLFAFSNAISVYVLLPARMDRWVSMLGVVRAMLSMGLMLAVAQDHGANGIAGVRVVAELLIVLTLVFLWRRHAPPP